MISADKLLPSNSTPTEFALADVMSADVGLPLRQIVDPAASPPVWLPFLAAHESVDLWYEDWPEARKRLMISMAARLASIKGTRAAATSFLQFVDTVVVHKRSYPARFPVGKIAAGTTPIQHPNFTARFLLKVGLRRSSRALLVGRSIAGRSAIRTFNREPIRRAKHALVVSKAPETAYTVTFAHRVPITMDDGIDLDAGHPLGAFRDRIRI